MSDEQTSLERTFGKYELIDRLGRGGMADVWRARVAGPQGFSRTLVLKRILPHLTTDPKARQLFEREARVVSRLSHAGIVQVFEFGEVGGEYYLAMEYVEGQDLSALIRAGGAGPGFAAMICRDVCRALAYAHALRDEGGTPLRIVHRDVSPSNIMIGYDGSVRLLDFGIAKAFADPRDLRTVRGTIRGKFGYIAPEVIQGKEPDARADLFSVGVVLHEAMSGKRLFRGASDLETLALVRRAEVPPPSSLNPAVPPILDEICLRALARDRDQRYPDGDQMADALDDAVHQLRVRARDLADAVERLFPRTGVAQWMGQEDSGPRTVQETPMREAGLGTARADPTDEHRTTEMPEAQVQALVQETRGTVAGRKVRTAQPLPVVAEPEARPTEIRPTVAPPPERRSTLRYVLAALILLGLVGVSLLVGRWVGRAVPAGSFNPAPAQPAVYQ